MCSSHQIDRALILLESVTHSYGWLFGKREENYGWIWMCSEGTISSVRCGFQAAKETGVI